MCKPIDYDSELKALADKTKALKERRVRQLGELVTACRADALDADVLAGALLAAATTKDTATRGNGVKAGEAFFRKSSQSRKRTRAQPQSAAASSGPTQPDVAGAGAP